MSAFWDKLKKKNEDTDKADEKGKSLKVDEKRQVESKEKVESEKKSKKRKEEPESVKSPGKTGSGKKESKKAVKKTKKSKKKSFPKEKAHLINRVVVRPKVSEASMSQQALGKYVFIVRNNATKNEVAKAIESMYGVSVEKVNICKYAQRAHQFRGFKGSKKGFKKAIVSLGEGKSIDVFSE